MSRVYFHARSRTVGIGGSQRAGFGVLCTRLAKAIFDIDADGFWLDRTLAPFRAMLKPGHYAHSTTTDREFAQRMSTLVSISDEAFFWNGHPVEMFAVSLNTALMIGSNAVRLAARLHGQCELHAYVRGPNRAWLADLIQDGLGSGLYNRSIGQPPFEWSDVVDLLRESDREEIVTSYSVCSQFPSAGLVVGESDDADDDLTAALARETARERFYEMDKPSQWEQAFNALQAIGGGLELRPDNWSSFRFVHKLSAFDLVADDWRARLDAAFPSSPPA